MNSRNRLQQGENTCFVAASGRSSGFSLIELLVVMSIIGILAAMILYLGPAISALKVRKLVQAQMAQVTTVIDSYKEVKGFYPPDNPDLTKPFMNTLYYELTASKDTGVDYQTLCGVQDILNIGDGSKNFHKSIKDNQFVVDPSSRVKLLIVKTKSPTGDYAVWNYRVSKSETDKAMHNPHSYDLWVEVLVNGKPTTFGNWKEKE